MQGRIMHRFQQRAKQCQGYQGVRHGDLGLFMVQKLERATLPDGTRYELESTWVENPGAKVYHPGSTQTGTEPASNNQSDPESTDLSEPESSEEE